MIEHYTLTQTHEYRHTNTDTRIKTHEYRHTRIQTHTVKGLVEKKINKKTVDWGRG
jgi:hypothetical protein